MLTLPLKLDRKAETLDLCIGHDTYDGPTQPGQDRSTSKVEGENDTVRGLGY